MNNQTDDKLSAMLTGLATTAAVHFLRRDSDNQDRLNRSRDDIDALQRRIQDMQSNGHWLRDSSAVVADLLSGVALARSEESTPTVLPNLSQITRPQLITALQAGIGNFAWPPKEGEYTTNGYIEKAGELVSLGLILTFEEVRAFLHGLVLDAQPTTEQKITTFYAASELVRAIVAKNFSRAQWKATWERLFGPQPHAAAPAVVQTLPNVTAQLLTGAKDSALVVKITVGAGGINAGTQVAKVTFGTSYTNVPAVIPGGPFRAEPATPQDFILMSTQAFNAGDVVNIPVIVGSTDG